MGESAPMTPDLFAFLVTIGVIAALVGVIVFIHIVHDDSLRDIGGGGWVIMAALTLAWLWLPWLVYGLTLLPWSSVTKIMPPVADTETRYNPNGGLPTVEKGKP